MSIENVGRLLDAATLVFERDFSVNPERLWRAVSTREGLGNWFMPTPFEIEEGGRFAFEGGWEGTVSRIDPPRCIEFTPADSKDAFLRFEVEKTATGSRLRLTDRMDSGTKASELFGDDVADIQIYQPGGRGTHWSGAVAGYHGFVDALEDHLRGTGRRPFDYDDLARRYMPLLDRWHARFSS